MLAYSAEVMSLALDENLIRALRGLDERIAVAHNGTSSCSLASPDDENDGDTRLCGCGSLLCVI